MHLLVGAIEADVESLRLRAQGQQSARTEFREALQKVLDTLCSLQGRTRTPDRRKPFRTDDVAPGATIGPEGFAGGSARDDRAPCGRSEWQKLRCDNGGMMHTPSRFAALTDDHLLAELRRLAATEREATAQLIAALMEVDTRRLYLGQGCSSLFTYCTQVLHLSEQAAYGHRSGTRGAAPSGHPASTRRGRGDADDDRIAGSTSDARQLRGAARRSPAHEQAGR